MAGSPPHGPVSHRLALHRRLIGLGMRECSGVTTAKRRRLRSTWG